MNKYSHLEPRNWQERHSPTEMTEVIHNLATKRVKAEARIRRQDKRLYDGLTPLQIQAMEFIRDGFEYATRGLGCKIMMYEPHIPSTAGDTGTGRHSRSEDRRYDYMQWHREGASGGYHPQSILDIAVNGLSLRATAKKYQKSRHWVKANLEDGLSAYCKMCGWG